MSHIDQSIFVNEMCSKRHSSVSYWKGKTQAYLRKELDDFLLTDTLPTVEQTAAAFGVSVRGLQRSLAKEETSFVTVFSEVRAQSAVSCLANSGTSGLSVAIDLGYTDQSNFNRAFRRWFKMSPVQFREMDIEPACQKCPCLSRCLMNQKCG